MPGTLQDYAQAVHAVIVVCRDGEQGYRGAAQSIKAPTIRELFERYSAQRGQFATELQGAVKALGFEAINPQGLGGVLFAGWMNLKGLLTGHDVHAILVEAERGEDWTLKTYRTALGRTLPPEIGSIIQKQFEEVEEAHNRIKSLRDSTAPPPDQDEETPVPAAPSNVDAPRG